MKLDMHCHVKEGSIDSKVSLDEYITLLKEQGFQGMLITDHNTYNGYRYWKNQIRGKKHTDFVVLKGIEYDTCDAGHIIVIMPEGVRMRLLEAKGLPVAKLIDFVHKNGGILGPAHPCGEKYLSLTNTKGYQKNPEIIQKFDFIEAFNTCEPDESNRAAFELAQKYGKPMFGGSDSHRQSCVGQAYTILPEDVTCETELITLIRKKPKLEAGGTMHVKASKEIMGPVSKALTYSFWVYNKGGAAARSFKRRAKGREENPADPIDPIEAEYLKKKAKKSQKGRLEYRSSMWEETIQKKKEEKKYKKENRH